MVRRRRRLPLPRMRKQKGAAKNIDQQVIETEKMSNTGMSILDMAKKMTVTVDETNQPKAKGEDGE